MTQPHLPPVAGPPGTASSTRRRPGRSALRTAAAAATATALAAGVYASGVGPGIGTASSHREAPLIAGDPRVDNTDVYAFVSPDKPDTVTLLANWIPFQEPNGGPNFYTFATDARYNIHVDNDGDARADVSYSWTFKDNIRDDANQFLYNTGPVTGLDDPDLNVFQTYELTRTTRGESRSLITNAVVAPSNVGVKSMPDYATLRRQAVRGIPDGGQTFAGQADDSFFLDLRVFDLLYGGDLSEVGQDTLGGYNVNTLAVQVPKTQLAISGDASANPVIGVWSTTERRGASVTSAPAGAATADGFVQVSRLGNPLVNEVVVPLKFKDAFNGLTPDKDATIQPVVDKVLNPILPGLLQAIYKLPAPPTPRNDLFTIFLTGVCKECKGPDGNAPLPVDLNSQMLNRDGKKGAEFVPAELMRLNMAIAPSANPNRLGVLAKDLAGFPNGRRLIDDVVDIELQAVAGAVQTGTLVPALAAGDAVDQNDLAFGQSFPYVALPHFAAVNRGVRGGGRPSVAAVPSTGGAPVSGGAPSLGATGGQVAPIGGVAAGSGGASGSSLPLWPAAGGLAALALAGSSVLVMRGSRA
ncbi:MAG: DUF4331 domain-containing protein [Acidimicrobiales bacterium]